MVASPRIDMHEDRTARRKQFTEQKQAFIDELKVIVIYPNVCILDLFAK